VNPIWDLATLCLITAFLGCAVVTIAVGLVLAVRRLDDWLAQRALDRGRGGQE
jgi:hypothetical protein